ncbi:MAG: HAD family hydrolase [Anaerolineaceae bacterium]|jgi:putative hydrolase of the HAD superfamily
MTKRALIFDMDGLIVDTETFEAEMWQELYAQAGGKFDMEKYLDLVGLYPIDHLYAPQGLSDLLQGERSASEVDAEFRVKAFERSQSLPLMPGVSELLDEAEELGLILAVGSSSPREWVHMHLNRLGIFHRFATIVTFDDVENPKPAPDIYNLVLERIGVDGENALILEDSVNGIRAALAAGIRVLAVPNPTTKRQDLSGAEKIYPSLKDIHLSDYFPSMK